ncbi:CYT protein, partial [Geococcyx californianus]|nr:CYT protein [Geococcyx californianus]
AEMAGARGAALAAVMLLVMLGSPALGTPELSSEEEGPIVGAPEEITDPEKDGGLQRALRFAVAEYNRESNDRFSSRVVRIISARKQVVSGLNYMMEVEIARTTCTNPPSNLQSCPIQPRSQVGSKRTICNFTVYVIPWENKMELTEHRCH